MYLVEIDEGTCVGCNACTAGCPAKILTFNGEKAEVTGDATECLGCESCVVVCPSEAITVQEI